MGFFSISAIVDLIENSLTCYNKPEQHTVWMVQCFKSSNT